MSKEIDTTSIAQIVARVKARDGQQIDEKHLANVLESSLEKIRHENAERYIQIINELSTELTKLAAELGKANQTIRTRL